MTKPAPIHPAADALITRAVNLTDRVLRARSTDPLDVLRAEAQRLLADLVTQQRAFARDHGPDAANPTNATAYLVSILLEHATFLRPDAREPSPVDTSDLPLRGRGAP